MVDGNSKIEHEEDDLIGWPADDVGHEDNEEGLQRVSPGAEQRTAHAVFSFLTGGRPGGNGGQGFLQLKDDVDVAEGHEY